jgi:hypothetical protein
MHSSKLAVCHAEAETYEPCSQFADALAVLLVFRRIMAKLLCLFLALGALTACAMADTLKSESHRLRRRIHTLGYSIYSLRRPAALRSAAMLVSQRSRGAGS